MRKFAVSLFVIALLLVLAVPAFADEIEVTNNGADSLVIGGYLRFVGWIQDNDEGYMKNDDSFRLRHARVAVKGSLPNNFSFKVQADFAPDEVTLKDGYLKWNNDEKTFYIMGGQFKVPFSMSETTSSSNLWTIERPMVVGELAPSRQIGMAIGGTFDTETDWNWAAGVWNGNGEWENTDDNDPFIVGGRLEYGQRDDFLIGVDVVGGAQGGGSSSESRHDLMEVGGHVAIQWDDNNEDEVNEWMFEGEYLYREVDPLSGYYLDQGEGGSDDTWQSDGWWAQLGYWFNPNWHGHLQVDQYDPDNDYDDDEYTDFTFGFTYAWMGWLDPHHEKVTFEYVHHDEAGTDYDNDEIRGLWQLTF
jgi:hypothetical protein